MDLGLIYILTSSKFNPNKWLYPAIIGFCNELVIVDLLLILLVYMLLGKWNPLAGKRLCTFVCNLSRLQRHNNRGNRRLLRFSNYLRLEVYAVCRERANNCINCDAPVMTENRVVGLCVPSVFSRSCRTWSRIPVQWRSRSAVDFMTQQVSMQF